MLVVSRTGEFFLGIVIVLVKFVNPASVTLHSLPHCVVFTGSAKSLCFLVRGWRRRRDLLSSFIIELVNVELIHLGATQTKRPSLGFGNLRTECLRLRHVAVRAWQHCMLSARIVIGEPVRSSPKGVI